MQLWKYQYDIVDDRDVSSMVCAAFMKCSYKDAEVLGCRVELRRDFGRNVLDGDPSGANGRERLDDDPACGAVHGPAVAWRHVRLQTTIASSGGFR